MTSFTKEAPPVSKNMPAAAAAAESCPVASLLASRDATRADSWLGLYAVALLVLDSVLLVASLWGINWIRPPRDPDTAPLFFFVLPLLILIGCLYLIDGYKVNPELGSTSYATHHVLAVGMGILLSLFLSYVVFHQVAAESARRANFAIAFLAFLPVSLYYRRLFCKRALTLAQRSSVFFLGGIAAAKGFYRDAVDQPGLGKVIYASAGAETDVDIGEDGTFLRPLDLSLFKQHEGAIGAVVCAEGIDGYSGEVLRLLMNLRLMSVPVFTHESFYEARLRKIPFGAITPGWLFKEGFRIAHDPVYLHVKRMSDICLAVGGLLVTAPIFLLVALVVKLTSPGPVFFRQSRIGLNKEPFSVYKFRTMKVGSENGNAYTQDHDPRLTPVGGLLRKLRLDELPQLWNVLKGDMSLIGPRAEWDKLVTEYEQKIPFYHFRHMVKPGITGWAQVNYPYGANLRDTVKKLEYDLYYIRHFSFLLDASIFLKTIHTMLFGKGK